MDIFLSGKLRSFLRDQENHRIGFFTGHTQGEGAQVLLVQP